MFAVGGTVANQVNPNPIENKKNVSSVFGESRYTNINKARDPYMMASKNLLLKNWVNHPIVKLPTTLDNPMIPSAQLATVALCPQS